MLMTHNISGSFSHSLSLSRYQEKGKASASTKHPFSQFDFNSAMCVRVFANQTAYFREHFIGFHLSICIFVFPNYSSLPCKLEIYFWCVARVHLPLLWSKFSRRKKHTFAGGNPFSLDTDTYLYVSVDSWSAP
jgi:hypothetical protein